MITNNKNTKRRLKISARGGQRKKKNLLNKKNIRPVSKTIKKKKKSKIRINKSADLLTKAKDKEIYKSLSRWESILKGHPVFILGNSPSITGHKLSLLDDYFTLGVNRIFYIYDPTVLFWQDIQIWNSGKKKILHQKSIRVCSFNSDPRKTFLNFKVIQGKYRFTKDGEHLYGTGNTTALAVQLSIYMGCSSIILLGTDCEYEKGGKTDFYGKNRDHKPYTLKMCRSSSEWIKKNCPVPVYNCSKNSCWESMDLIDVIKKIKPIKMNREKFQKMFRK